MYSKLTRPFLCSRLGLQYSWVFRFLEVPRKYYMGSKLYSTTQYIPVLYAYLASPIPQVSAVQQILVIEEWLMTFPIPRPIDELASMRSSMSDLLYPKLYQEPFLWALLNVLLLFLLFHLAIEGTHNISILVPVKPFDLLLLHQSHSLHLPLSSIL